MFSEIEHATYQDKSWMQPSANRFNSSSTILVWCFDIKTRYRHASRVLPKIFDQRCLSDAVLSTAEYCAATWWPQSLILQLLNQGPGKLFLLYTCRFDLNWRLDTIYNLHQSSQQSTSSYTRKGCNSTSTVNNFVNCFFMRLNRALRLTLRIQVFCYVHKSTEPSALSVLFQ